MSENIDPRKQLVDAVIKDLKALGDNPLNVINCIRTLVESAVLILEEEHGVERASALSLLGAGVMAADPQPAPLRKAPKGVPPEERKAILEVLRSQGIDENDIEDIVAIPGFGAKIIMKRKGPIPEDIKKQAEEALIKIKGRFKFNDDEGKPE